MLAIVYAARPAVVAALALAVGCSGSSESDDLAPVSPPPASTGAPATPSTPRPSPPPALAATDWPTYHRGGHRSGVSPTTPTVHSLQRSWTARLDQTVFAQPLVIGRRVIAATENDTVYALDVTDGQQLWRAHLGRPIPGSQLPCGNIDPLGITGTPVYDPVTERIFAVAETATGAHTLFGLDVATGRVEVRAAAEPPKGDRIAHQQRAALLLTAGRVYVAYGGLAGDCANYIGSVVSLTTDGTGRQSWAVPTTREGGIWAPGGPVLGPGGSLYVSIGNGEQTAAYDGSDSVTRLSPQLERVDFFAPNEWPEDNAGDLDLGSMPPALVGDRMVISGKRGTAYLLDPRRLGHIGGQIAALETCAGYGTAAVHGSNVYLPCLEGVQQIRVRPGGLTAGWQGPPQTSGPPVIGGGVVWSVGRGDGVVSALDLATGRVRATVDVGDVEHFASPALSGARAYVPTTRGIVAITIR